MQIAYIHGFNSSHRSFNYVTSKLPTHDIVVINYDSHQPLDDSVAQVLKQLPKKPFVLVGHSLGGVISTLIAVRQPEKVEKLVTISSPLAGSRAACTLKWIPGYPKIFSDITPSSKLILALEKVKLETPTLSIISTGGSLPTGEANDSIVTVSSQRALKFGKKVEIKANHFEVLVHERTVKHIRDFIFTEEQL